MTTRDELFVDEVALLREALVSLLGDYETSYAALPASSWCPFGNREAVQEARAALNFTKASVHSTGTDQ
jgi:hypothetical protein